MENLRDRSRTSPVIVPEPSAIFVSSSARARRREGSFSASKCTLGTLSYNVPAATKSGKVHLLIQETHARFSFSGRRRVFAYPEIFFRRRSRARARARSRDDNRTVQFFITLHSYINTGAPVRRRPVYFCVCKCSLVTWWIYRVQPAYRRHRAR